MTDPNPITRREFLNRSLVSAGAAGVVAAAGAKTQAVAADNSLPVATLGKAKISRVLLGGNLISGCMHSRDLKYVNDLFRAYATEQKMLETLKLAEECGINTVFETGAKFVQRYNREFNGHMQFIPHIQVKADQNDDDLRVHIEKQVESGAVALYVWGVAADKLVQAGEVKRIAKAVELAKLHDLPVGVGGHSLLVPMACEKHGIPCDFYVKTFHRDNYPSATPKELRKEFIWLDGGKGWYDNMWCINPEETAEFMKTVSKPWIAFKVLAAGAIPPKDGFTYAFKNGADLIAVGMLDFQIRENCDLARKVISQTQKRDRPWRV
ncbi:MAG: hypothetical protein FJ388_08730 [Verrucomicrobia bacterium]|nr:hypothetical protein [Verrucomicrobiota bacterium]